MKAIVSNMSEDNGAVLSAMLLAEKSVMDGELKEQYQKIGLSPLLAISGLHISFIGLGIYHLLRKVRMSYVGAGIWAILILSAYVLMIGYSVSVIRAYLMLLLRIGGDISGRIFDMRTALMLSAALIVLCQPLYLTDAAFYMSHGAILGLIYILAEIKKSFPVKIKWLEGCFASIAIHVALFPVLLWFYYEIPMYSVLINMVAIPLMTGVLGFGMLGSMVAFCFRTLGMILLKPCDWMLSFFDWIGKIGCRLPLSTVVFGKPNWWEVGIYYILLLVGILLLKRNKRKLVLPIVVLSVLLFVKFPNGNVQVTMLDVGQGDCIFLKGPRGSTYLIDGGSSDVEQVGKYRIEPFLKSQGVGKLDYVFVSHGDMDHYNGIKEMLERQLLGVKIERLVMPANFQQDEKLLEILEIAKENGIDACTIEGGQMISEGELEIRCLQPT